MIKIKNFSFNTAVSPVYKQGNGKTFLLILHGWGSSIESWKQLIAKIDSTKFTVYFLELPGFGQSTPPIHPFKVQDYADFVVQFIKQENTANRPVQLLVHSFGGRIAIDILANKKIEITKAYFLAAAGIKPKLNWFKRFTKKFSKTVKQFLPKKLFNFLKVIVYKIHRSSDYLQLDGVMKEIFINTINYDQTDLLKEIETKVILIWGTKDTLTPLYMGRLMHEEIPNSQLVVVNKATHGLHYKNIDLILSYLD